MSWCQGPAMKQVSLPQAVIGRHSIIVKTRRYEEAI